MTTAFIFFVALIATALSSVSGVGTGVITVPAWLSLGYAFPAAIASNKVAAVVWVPIPAYKYLRERHFEWPIVLLMALTGLCGAWLGAMVTISIDERILRRILGAIILLLCLWTLRHREFGLTVAKPIKRSALWLSAAALPLGFYEGFFGTGNGVFSTLAFAKIRGFDLVGAMGHYYCLAFLWCLFAALFYGHHGFVEPALVVPAACGSLCGSYIGSHIAVKKGAPFVKKMFILCGLLFGILLATGIA